MRTIPQDLIRDKVYCVNYIEYLNDANTSEHFYIAVRQDEMDKFKEVIKQGNFDAEDYGLILEQGQGPASQMTRDKMKMLYQCNHENAINVSDYFSNLTPENLPS